VADIPGAADPSTSARARIRDAAARKGVPLEIIEFATSTHSAEEAARALGVAVDQIVKSLVFVAPQDDGRLEPYVILVAGSDRVDTERLAAVTGEPAIRQATAAEAEECTGFEVGAIPPFGHAGPIQVIMDPALGRHETIWASGGTASAMFSTTPAALRSLANASAAPVVVESPRSGFAFPGLEPADATTGA
jgi:Cys-tRNA(Pro) deacylase